MIDPTGLRTDVSCVHCTTRLDPDPLYVSEDEVYVMPKRTRIDPREVVVALIWATMVLGIIALAASVMGKAVAS